ncbi:MAG: tRNA (adenosine(37)-N6)-dimethylallyltransferase MiaA [Clostridia bacterium]|nr:tRNA (adenosine(37)-N6)-dimethylallyltransferase MiaA [Clostridia bacterium]
MSKRIIAIIGPTASGKTALATKLAKKLSGEVVSCDSMQIYRGMDIGTAKPTEDEMQFVPHHMIDIAEPSQRFSVADFVSAARECIEDILKRGKVPILAGGTGLYVDSVLFNISFPDFNEDPEFRLKMQEVLEEEGKEALHMRLFKCDPEAAEKIHPNNTRRVIRALEVCKATGKTFTQVSKEARRTPEYDAYVLGIETDRAELYKRIDSRVDVMMENGLLDEVKRLKESGIGRDTTAMQAIGYKELYDYFDRHISLDEAVEKIKQESRRYAKRQMTWFRRNEDIDWVRLDSDENIEKIFERCIDFLKKN